VQFVLKPVKPSDLLKAVTKLAVKGGANDRSPVLSSDSGWLHDSLASASDHNELHERLEAAGVNAAANTVENLGRKSVDDDLHAVVDSERRRNEKRRDSFESRSSSEKQDDKADSGAGGVMGTTGTTGSANTGGANPSSATTSGAKTYPPPGDLAGMSVLLVEDNLMNQQMAKYSIVKAGADIDIANHGKEAVEMVMKRLNAGLGNYDCVLMDMMMPVMDGAEATVAIREFEKTFYASEENSGKRSRKAHVIVGLSANVGPEYTAKVKEAGMNGSMSKPFYPATLRHTLQQVLHKTYQGFKRASGDADVGSKPGN
jgi:CheY-like chemotaxis protein